MVLRGRLEIVQRDAISTVMYLTAPKTCVLLQNQYEEPLFLHPNRGYMQKREANTSSSLPNRTRKGGYHDFITCKPKIG